MPTLQGVDLVAEFAVPVGLVRGEPGQPASADFLDDAGLGVQRCQEQEGGPGDVVVQSVHQDGVLGADQAPVVAVEGGVAG